MFHWSSWLYVSRAICLLDWNSEVSLMIIGYFILVEILLLFWLRTFNKVMNLIQSIDLENYNEMVKIDS